jgi:hypothetical protein
MNQIIQNNEIIALRERREHREIREVAATEEERPFGMKECRRRGFERFVFGRIAAQQPRAPAPIGIPRARATASASATRFDDASPK